MVHPIPKIKLCNSNVKAMLLYDSKCRRVVNIYIYILMVKEDLRHFPARESLEQGAARQDRTPQYCNGRTRRVGLVNAHRFFECHTYVYLTSYLNGHQDWRPLREGPSRAGHQHDEGNQADWRLLGEGPSTGWDQQDKGNLADWKPSGQGKSRANWRRWVCLRRRRRKDQGKWCLHYCTLLHWGWRG